jgi:hypothetical protein
MPRIAFKTDLVGRRHAAKKTGLHAFSLPWSGQFAQASQALVLEISVFTTVVYLDRHRIESKIRPSGCGGSLQSPVFIDSVCAAR